MPEFLPPQIRRRGRVAFPVRYGSSRRTGREHLFPPQIRRRGRVAFPVRYGSSRRTGREQALFAGRGQRWSHGTGLIITPQKMCDQPVPRSLVTNVAFFRRRGFVFDWKRTNPLRRKKTTLVTRDRADHFVPQKFHRFSHIFHPHVTHMPDNHQHVRVHRLECVVADTNM